MIWIETLDLEAQRAVLRAPANLDASGREAMARTRECLQRLGVETIDVVPRGRPRGTGDGPSAGAGPLAQRDLVLQVPRLLHQGRIENGVPTYVGQFPQEHASLKLVSLYTRCILATIQPVRRQLDHVHLLVYELCANVVDHGVPLRPQPTVQLGLRLETQAVIGWVHDECHAFDPRQQPLPARDGPRQRRARGYGLHLIRGVADALDHRFDVTGNTVEFRKEIAR